MLIFDVAQLVNKSDGTMEKHSVHENVFFDPSENLSAHSHLIGELTFLKLSREISVHMKNFEIDIECTCSRCLKRYPEHIVIDSAEREFLIDVPETQLTEGEDFFLVDTKYWKISLLEMLRQEILLHFPAVPVCWESCKGLCDECGVNLNTNSCLHHPAQ